MVREQRIYSAVCRTQWPLLWTVSYGFPPHLFVLRQWILKPQKKICICWHAFAIGLWLKYTTINVFPAAFTKIFILIWMLSIKLNNTCIFRCLECEMLLIFLCGTERGHVLLQQFAQLTSHSPVASRGLRDTWKVEWTFLLSFCFITPSLLFLELCSLPSLFAYFFLSFYTTLF